MHLQGLGHNGHTIHSFHVHRKIRNLQRTLLDMSLDSLCCHWYGCCHKHHAANELTVCSTACCYTLHVADRSSPTLLS